MDAAANLVFLGGILVEAVVGWLAGFISISAGELQKKKDRMRRETFGSS